MSRRGRRCAMLLALTVGTAPACYGGEGGELAVRTDSAGVQLVRIPGSDRPAPVALHEQFRLGGDDTREEQSFHQVTRSNVATDDAGNIHVLDFQARRVFSFDGAGGFVRSVGRPGGGPGEIGMPFGLVVDRDGTIGVIDISRHGLVRFGAAGEPLPVQPFPPGYRGGHLHLSGAAMVAPVQLPLDGGERWVEALIRAASDDTTSIVTLPQPELKAIQLASCGMGFSGMPPVFSPTLRWDARGERIAVARSDAYDVEIFESGRLVQRIRRAVEPTRATAALAIEEQDGGLRVGTSGGVVVCDPAEFVETVGVAPTIPAIGELAISPDGGLWVRRGGVRGAPRAVDLFDAEGEYRGSLPPGSPFPVLFLGDGHIAAAERDEDDVARLVVYRIEPR
jgi:hypothetical protein